MHVHTSPRQRLRRPGLILAAALSLVLIPRGPLAGANDSAPRAAFTIQQHDQTSWLVSPDGERFVSLGVCCVNQGVPPGEFDPANPGYAAWRRYADSNQWARATVERLKAWGFTTVGGWSDFQSLRQRPEHDLAFAPVLHIGATAGAPWWDMRGS